MHGRGRYGLLAGLLALPLGGGVGFLQLQGLLVADGRLFWMLFWLCSALLVWLLTAAMPLAVPLGAPGRGQLRRASRRGGPVCPACAPPDGGDRAASAQEGWDRRASVQAGWGRTAAPCPNAAACPCRAAGHCGAAAYGPKTGRAAPGRADGDWGSGERGNGSWGSGGCADDGRISSDWASDGCVNDGRASGDWVSAGRGTPAPVSADPLCGLGPCLLGGCGLCLAGALGGLCLQLPPLGAALWLGGLAAAFGWLLLCLLALACFWGEGH